MLVEFRASSGARLCDALVSRGWRYFESTSPVGRVNGLCVLSRTPIVCIHPCPAPKENSERWLEVSFPAHNFGVGLLHIVAAESKGKCEGKTSFWNAVLQAAHNRLAEPFLFIGDFNTGAPFTDEVGNTFACAEHFAKLSAFGWTDMWRHYNRETREGTWYSSKGNGFRLDHAFASPSLRPRIASCRYSHVEREAKVSDHSILIVEVD